jgi:hypothetical protein
MKNTESHSLIPRKGMFDLQGYKPKKSILPLLNSTKNRSVTPEFTSIPFSTASDLSAVLNKTNDFRSSKQTDRYMLPIDLSAIKAMVKPLNYESFPISHDSKAASNRQLLISLEKWFHEASEKHSSDLVPVIELALQELVKEINAQCSNRARIILLIFRNFKDYSLNKTHKLVSEAKERGRILNELINERLEETLNESEQLKKTIEKLSEKSTRIDERNLLISRENDILKQIIIRFQMQYRLEPINFSKICELIIEDLADSTKRTQKKILNTILPKCYQNSKIQTIETHSVQYFDKAIQLQVLMKDKETQDKPSTSSIPSQTRNLFRKKKLLICNQGSINLFNISKLSSLQPKLLRKKTRLLETIDLLPSNIFGTSKENNLIFEKDAEIPSLDLKKSLKFNDSLQNSQNSARSLKELRKSFEYSKENTLRAITPHPNKQKSFLHRKQVTLKQNQKAREVLTSCLKMNQKDLIFESTLSLRSLLKTIESMFFSCIPKLRQNIFRGFLEHVYGRFSSKYSLRRIKQRRLRDLIASASRYKDHLMAKLFLRAIGAGGLVGLSNYSVHTLKIILQVLSYFKAHLFGSPLINFHGRKMCSKSKALEFIKDVFQKRLDHSDYLRMVQQVELHTEVDPFSTRGPMVEIEWIISYSVFSFDLFEKQVTSGLKIVTDAVTLANSATFPMKAEVLIAVQAFYPDSSKILNDQNNWKIFPFLHPSVSNRSLISFELLERFCLFRGLFKAKHVSLFKNNCDQKFDGSSLDQIQMKLDGISDQMFLETLTKEDWIRKLEILKDYKEADFAFAILFKGIEKILEKAN